MEKPWVKRSALTMRECRRYRRTLSSAALVGMLLIAASCCGPAGHNVPDARATQSDARNIDAPARQGATAYGYTEVYITTPNHWWLKISPNGAGAFGYGSGPPYDDGFPAGTFDFDDVVAKALPKISATGSPVTDCAVYLIQPNTPATEGFVLKDSAMAFHWFDQARRTPRSPGSEIEDIWSKDPPGEVRGGSARAGNVTATREPADVDERMVDIGAANGWTLNIRPNGGAEFFIEGGSVGDEAGIDPVGTFNFNEIFAAATAAQPGNTAISVGFSPDPVHPQEVFCRNVSEANAGYFFGLYVIAYKAAHPDPQSGVARLWLKFPPSTQPDLREGPGR
ncbi:MAG: hypothetical protein ABSH22_07530 [Tepidisphaeraceae bacterium]|jgi:hypothetical protein